MKKCKRSSLIPEGFRLKSTRFTNNQCKEICDQASRKLMNNTIKVNYGTLAVTERQIRKVQEKLEILNNLQPQLLPEWCYQFQNRIPLFRDQVKKRLFKKFLMLMNEKKRNQQLELSNKQTINYDKVVDLTRRRLTINEKEMLNLGLNFIPTTKLDESKYVAHVIATIQSALYNTNTIQKELIIREVSKTIDNHLPTAIKNNRNKNLNQKQLSTLKNLKSDNEIIVVGADKGGKVVALDVEEYKTKIKAKLSTNTYEIVRSKPDPAKKIHEELSELVKILKKVKAISNRQ
ncbi:unnamed protein product [Didymodactylos carnosus]|uniref:Uncharacterized protein n=1 Tax=Didymodactylos carnosus TaxID=1234261 RepID=A0A813NS34_9BILA|nr:unnamed protein product [Didymodactylos carnosus]CAF3522377.1 unnamed protein product [Didymodactylos carnosus]